MIGEWTSNIDPPPSHCIVVIQTGDNSSADAHFTLFEASVREGSDIARFHDTRNRPNTAILKKIGAQILKNIFALRRTAWKPSSVGRPKRRLVTIVPQMPTLLFLKHQCLKVLTLPGFMTPEMGQIQPYSRSLEQSS